MYWNDPCVSSDHYKIPSSAQTAYGGVTRKTDVKHNLKRRACGRAENGEGWKQRTVSLCLSESFQHVKWQAWALIAFCCVLGEIHLHMLDGLAETSSGRLMNAIPWHIKLGFYNDPRQWLTHRNLVTRINILTAHALDCKVELFTSERRFWPNWPNWRPAGETRGQWMFMSTDF